MVECKDPARTLDLIENASEAMDAIVRYSYEYKTGGAQFIRDIADIQRWLDEIKDTHFVVEE